MNSQIEPTKEVYEILKKFNINKIVEPSELVTLQNKMLDLIGVIQLTEKNEKDEEEIRWKRTGAEVLHDKFVYEGKSCTDLVVAFLTLCQALELNTRFVKLKSITTEKMHSIAEIQIAGKWYMFNASVRNQIPEEGEMIPGKLWGQRPNGPYNLWKKGRDSWDIGLQEIKDSEKMF